MFPKYLGELEAYFREHEHAEAIEVPAESKDGEPETPPAHLKTFVTDDNLRQLLTLHPYQGQENEDANFTIWRDGKYRPIPEEEIRAYIRLTRSITADQKKVRSQSSGQIFINRQAQLQAFLKMLDGSGEEHILIVTGARGIGKTMLLQRYAQECFRRGIPVAQFNLSTLHDSVVDFMRLIRDAFPNGDFSRFNNAVNSESVRIERLTYTFVDGLARIAQNNKVVILLDDYDLTSESLKNWIAHQFLFAIENVPNLIACIAGRGDIDVMSPLLSKRTVALTLGPFSKPDIAEYLKALDLQVTDEAVEVLQRISEGSPEKFAQAAKLINEKG